MHEQLSMICFKLSGIVDRHTPGWNITIDSSPKFFKWQLDSPFKPLTDIFHLVERHLDLNLQQYIRSVYHIG
jgi:hypothetical protein